MAESKESRGRLFTKNDLNEILSGLRRRKKSAPEKAPAPVPPAADFDQLKRRIQEGISRLRSRPAPAPAGEAAADAPAGSPRELQEMKERLLGFADLKEKYPLAISQRDQAIRERDDLKEDLRRLERRVKELERESQRLRREKSEVQTQLNEVRRALE